MLRGWFHTSRKYLKSLVTSLGTAGTAAYLHPLTPPPLKTPCFFPGIGVMAVTMPRTVRTFNAQEKRERFLKELRETANVSLAIRRFGMSRTAVYALRKTDPDFAQAWDDALEEAIDNLEAEARRRAFKGVKKPVYQGGALVGHIQEYSDSLTMFLLKGHRDRFKDKTAVELSGPNGGPIEISDLEAANRLAALVRLAKERKAAQSAEPSPTPDHPSSHE